MDLTEIVAWRASESLVFGDTNNAGRKKRNFNCRWGTKIVDISHRIFTKNITIIISILLFNVFLASVYNFVRNLI